MGTLLGYALYRKKSLNLSKSSLTIVWIAILSAYCIPLWDKVYWNYGQSYTPVVSALFYNFCQIVWSVCTSLMIWLCISGKGGLINTFLSHRTFVPMARLTYSVYLCHAWLIWYFMGSRRHVMDTHMYNCAIHTWFIALDFQYHIMTAALILVFLYNIKFGVILNIATIVMFAIISTILWYIYELPPALINTGRTEYFEKYFSFTIHKIPVSYGAVYFMGTLLGYALYRKKSLNLSKSSLTIVWIAILSAYCIPLWDKVYWNYGQSYTPVISALFYNFCQIVWSVCTSLMIWLCISGKGGLINTFLSHRAFVPMARLTYSVYLCHAWLIWYFMGSRRHVMDTHMYNVLINFIHITVMSYIMGF
ncbi:unnamed protein product, partial [Medioppia subpectinata]